MEGRNPAPRACLGGHFWESGAGPGFPSSLAGALTSGQDLKMGRKVVKNVDFFDTFWLVQWPYIQDFEGPEKGNFDEF